MRSKNIILFSIVILFIGGGIFYFFNNQENKETQASLNSKWQSLVILNPHYNPKVGDTWPISFKTEGVADLTITPDDQVSIDDLDFIFLTCNGEERVPQILENDVIFYPNWSCLPTDEAGNGEGQIIHLVTVARPHILNFQFGDQTAYAYNDPDSVTDTFSDESNISATSSVVVSGGVAKLAEAPAFFCSQASDYNSTSTVSGDLVYCDNSIRLWTPTAVIGGSANTYAWGGFETDEPTNSCIGIADRPACNYCDDLTDYAGYSDWVLPSCVSGAQDSGCILYQFGIDVCGGYSCVPSWDTDALAGYYWSSTEYNSTFAWVVLFDNGGVYIGNKDFNYYVRCVRGQ